MGGSSGGGGAGGGSSVPIYQPSGQPQADVNAQGAISNIYNNPEFQKIYGQAQGSVGGIPGMNTGYDPRNVTQQGINLQDAASGLPYMMQQIYQTAFDPQQALFQQMQQQVTDQTNAGLAQSGLTGSPYAEGIRGQNMAALDTNWQDHLLSREAQGAQSIDQLLGQYGKANIESAGLQFQGPQSQIQISEALAGLNQAVQSQNQQAVSDWLQYLSQGTQAGSAAAQQQMSLNEQSLQAQQMNMQKEMQFMNMGMGLLGPMLSAGKGG
jgi:hypothetical protein